MHSTRAAAREAGDKSYFSGEPCAKGHLAPRYVSNNNCYGCLKESVAVWRVNNPDRTRAHSRKSGRKHAEDRRARTRAWVKANPERKAAADKAWRESNRERWRTVKAAQQARRRECTPPWVDKATVDVFYEIAARVRKCTGLDFHVDHIEPVIGPDSCGLHVPWNLRVMPAKANQRKSNKTTERAA